MPLSSGYPNTPVPQCDCPEDCYEGDGGETGNDGGGSSDPTNPEDPKNPDNQTPGVPFDGGGGKDTTKNRPPLVTGPENENGRNPPKILQCDPPLQVDPSRNIPEYARTGYLSRDAALADRGVTGGVRVGTGTPMVNNSLCSHQGAAFNMPFGAKTTYDSKGSSPDNAFGNDWIAHDLGQLVFDGSNVIYMEGANQMEYFVSTGSGAFQSTYFVKSTLSQDTGTGVFTLISPDGSVKTFTPAGLLSAFTDAYGNQGTVSFTTAAGMDRVEEVEIVSAPDSVRYHYEWWPATGQLKFLTTYVNGRAVQQTEQTYYASGRR